MAMPMIAMVDGAALEMRVYSVVRPIDAPTLFEVLLLEKDCPSPAPKRMLAIGRGASPDLAAADALGRVWLVQ